jgi:hypothetical protein
MITQKQIALDKVFGLLRHVRVHLSRYRQYGMVLTLALMMSMGYVGHAVATTTSTSPHYSVTETQFGGGSQEHQCSTNYCAKSSAGDTTVGSGKSANYSAQFGSNTTDQPLLQVIAAGGDHALGVLDSDTTGTATSSLSVRTYLMQGYGIALTGSSPTQGTHAILPLSIPTESQAGTEQFGVNLVANTAPVTMGTNPTLVPSGASALDYIASGYSQTNKYKYIPGDILAENYQQNGEISYTLSMILNVSNVTPGGQYKGSFSAVVIPLF